MGDKRRAIFLSYRRDDTAGYTGRLYDSLVERVGKERVFMDVGSIGPGRDFVDVIKAALASGAAMIVVIGPKWLGVREQGTRRIDEPRDSIRMELETALERKVPIIPVLVQGASIPRVEQLPETLHALAQRNAIELSDTRWEADVDRLVASLEALVGQRLRQRQWRRVALTGVVLALIAGVTWVVQGMVSRSVPAPQPSGAEPEWKYRRINFESFDYPGEIPPKVLKAWPVGRHSDWQAEISSGVFRICNTTKALSASLTDRQEYVEPGTTVDLNDARVSLKVRLKDAIGEHTGGGILYRNEKDTLDYYAFVLSTGNAVTLYHSSTSAGDVRVLWASELSSPPPTEAFTSLAIVGHGPTLHLYVNNTLVHVEENAELLRGAPGIMVLGSGCFEFDDFAISVPITAP